MLFDKSAGARFHLGALIVDHLGSTVRLFRPGGLALALALVAGLTVTTSAVADETKTVSYRGYQVTVPANWPVVDLAADPTACVRLDQPAVYLGRSTSQANCPAHLVGRSSGLILEPLTTNTPSSDGLLRRSVTDAGVLATAYYAPGAEAAASDVLATGRVVTKTPSARVATPAAVTPSVVATGNFAGNGFDACTAPPQSTMDAWRPTYQGIGIYISGGLRACAQPNLTADWVATNASKGWQFLLIDVGYQAPCTTSQEPDVVGRLNRLGPGPQCCDQRGRRGAGARVRPAQRDLHRPRALHVDRGVQGRGAVVSEWLDPGVEFARLRRGRLRQRCAGGQDLVSGYTSTAYTRPDNIWMAQWNGLRARVGSRLRTGVITSAFISTTATVRPTVASRCRSTRTT